MLEELCLCKNHKTLRHSTKKDEEARESQGNSYVVTWHLKKKKKAKI